MPTPNRRRPRPTPLAIHNTPSPLIPANDDHEPPQEPPPRPSSRNMKNLSIALPAVLPDSQPHSPRQPPTPAADVPRPRRPSVISLPTTANPATSSFLHRKDEDAGGSPTVPYADGPVQVIPGIWLGSEDNVRDWKGLVERGIKSILNVAKEVSSPFDSLAAARPLRSVSSTPNFRTPSTTDSTYYPPHLASGRPAMHYLKLQWSHGQQDLVQSGFQEGMAFTDAALDRGEGVLIHCQCGISRSATMVIALVMRAAAERSTAVPPEVWALKGMQGAYSFVKDKSRWVGPNMSLIYQLLEYEKKLKGDSDDSDRSSRDEDEEEWGRKRMMLDEEPSDNEDARESSIVMQEARALDKAMEDRMVARKASSSSLASTNSGFGMGPAWRSRYGSRKRTGSVASSMTGASSMLSEDLVEQDEEQELLGVGGGFDDDHRRGSESSATTSPDDEHASDSDNNDRFGPPTARPLRDRLPPSAPVWKTSFQMLPPPPASAIRSTFNLGPPAKPKSKRRPPPIGVLPPVPSSPVTLITETEETVPPKPIIPVLPPLRKRVESRKPAPPPLHLRNPLAKNANILPHAATPSQTLFVFPPSPTLSTRTPSTMTLTSNVAGSVPFPTLTTPRVSTFRTHGRTRSFIGLAVPPTPTTGFSKVDARGYVGLE